MNGTASDEIEVEWAPGRGRLQVHFGGPTVEFTAPVVLHLAEAGELLDLEVRELPEPVVRLLAPYTAARHRPPVGGAVSLDYEAGWLWVHLAEGSATRRVSVVGRARLSFGQGLTGIDLTVPRLTAASNSIELD